MTRVYFKDHDRLARFAGEAGGIPYVDVLQPSLGDGAEEVDTLREADRALLHFNQDELTTLKSRWKREQSPQFAAYLVVSKGGQAALLSARHEEWRRQSDGATALLLYARNQRDALQRDPVEGIKTLKAFYQMQRSDAESIYNDLLSDIDNPLLQRLFEVIRTPDTLIALSILCQGYLIVHAKRGHVDGVPEDLMQAARELPEITADVEDVQGIDFWGVLKEDPSDNLMEHAQDEWRALKGEDDFSEVKELISAITTGEPVTDVSMVAAAHQAIARRLGNRDQ